MRYSFVMTTSGAAPAPRALRADAERNRALLVGVATDLFAEHGTAASLEDVARRAGVGIGTLYRRFPTRADLIVAVLGERVAYLADITEAAAEHARTDPARALSSYIYFLLGEQASDRALSDLLIEGLTPTATVFINEHARMRAARARLVGAAVEAGAVRGMRPEDLGLLLLAAAGLNQGTDGAGAEGGWERLTGITLAGFGLAAP